MKLRPLLFIAYNFPPHGGTGVQRSLKFVKYLPEFGWQPIVVSTTADANPVQDQSLLADIPPGTLVYRIPGFSISRLQSKAARLKLDRAAISLNLLLQAPDAALFWARKIRHLLGNLIKAERPMLVYTTSGPYSAHLVGKWVKQQYRLPWLADFRDPWSRNLLIPYLPGYRKLNRWMEKQVLAAADRVTSVSRPWLDDLQQNLGAHPEKFFILPNGYDEPDIHPQPFPTHNQCFTITHLGSFYRNRRPYAFIQAIDRLVHSGRIPSACMRVQFIGKNTRAFTPHRSPFEAHEYLPHKELPQIRAGTDVFLLILDASPQNVGNHSGKLFEYLASNRPVLGIVPTRGVAQELIQATRTGITVTDDPAEIEQAIVDLYGQWKNRLWQWNPDWNLIRQYTRRRLTERLALEFDRLSQS